MAAPLGDSFVDVQAFIRTIVSQVRASVSASRGRGRGEGMWEDACLPTPQHQHTRDTHSSTTRRRGTL